MKISHEECISHLNRNYVSSFESKHKIKRASNFKLIDAFGDIEFWEQQKTDNTLTFALVFKHGESWLFWIPTHNQIEILSEQLPLYYQKINEKNRRARGLKNRKI